MNLKILYVTLGLSIFITIYTVFLLIAKIKKEKYIAKVIDNLNENYKQRLEEEEEEKELNGKHKKSLFNKIDTLIERSDIRSKIPFLTSEIYIFTVLTLAIILSLTFYATYRTIIISAVIFVAIIMISVLGMKLITRITYDKIDQQVLTYINTMNNLCSSNDDIVTIIEKTIPYLKDPLKSYSEKFVFQVHKGIPIETAFKNFEDKIESKRFKQLLENLMISSKHAADYEKVLAKSRIIMKRYFEQKAKRSKTIKEGRISIATVTAIGLVAINMVSEITPGIKAALINTAVGKAILIYLLLLLLYTVYQIFTLDKLNY